MKKIILAMFLSISILAQAAIPAYGAAVLCMDGSQKQVILGFEQFDINDHALNLDIDAKPSLQQVLTCMPKTLGVYLDGCSEPENIEVEWFCVGEDYESSSSYYYQFSPKWDETQYILDEKIDLLTEAPYIAVFFQANEGISLASVTRNENEVKIYKYLTEELGYNTAAVCGVMANIYCESSFNPINLQNSYENKLGYTDASYTEAVDNGTYTNFVKDSAGYGLCQWTYYTRKQELLDFAKASGTSIGDLYMQLDFFEKEVSVTGTGRLMRSIKNTADGAYELAYYFCQNYERPSQVEDEKSVYRGNLAKNTYWTEYGETDFCPYMDINQNDWFYDSVSYCYKQGFMTGMNDLVFGPYECLSRAQFAVILYRMSGSPEVSQKQAFYDVDGYEWYADAVCWAAKNGIVTGYLDNNFGPADMITREQIALMMYRYANYLQKDTAAVGDLANFTDAAGVSGFAYTAMGWAVANGVVTGKNGGTILDSQGSTARAECAVIIQRFMELYR